MCRYVHMSVSVHRGQKRTLDSSHRGVTGSCKHPLLVWVLGTVQVLCKSNKFVIVEASLQSCHQLLERPPHWLPWWLRLFLLSSQRYLYDLTAQPLRFPDHTHCLLPICLPIDDQSLHDCSYSAPRLYTQSSLYAALHSRLSLRELSFSATLSTCLHAHNSILLLGRDIPPRALLQFSSPFPIPSAKV